MLASSDVVALLRRSHLLLHPLVDCSPNCFRMAIKYVGVRQGSTFSPHFLPAVKAVNKLNKYLSWLATANSRGATGAGGDPSAHLTLKTRARFPGSRKQLHVKWIFG